MSRPKGSYNRHKKQVTISERTAQVYTYMRNYLITYGRPPAMTQVAKDLGYAHTAIITKIVNKLVKNGLSPYVPDYATMTQGELVALFEDSPFTYEQVTQAYQQAKANNRYNKQGLTFAQVEAEWDVHTS